MRGSKGQRGARKTRPISLTEDPRLPRLSGAPGRFQGSREAQEVRGARAIRPPSLTEDPRLPKALKGSQGFLRLWEVPGAQGCSGVRGARRDKGTKRDEGKQGEQGPESD